MLDYEKSLSPLGVPLSLRQGAEELRGGMTLRSFTITYPDRKLRLTTYTYPDGKLEQYLIAPTQ
jgi:D-alanyl-D-alanine carboxypeptidase